VDTPTFDQQFAPFLSDLPIEDPLLWVIEVNSGDYLDATSRAAEILASSKVLLGERTVPMEEHLAIAREVAATGEPNSLNEWVNYDGEWRKVTLIKSRLGPNLILEASHDITHLDPRAQWLARINVETQRLELDSGESISFNEFVVLHLYITGFQQKQMADKLNISTKTVEYRMSRLKKALGVSSTRAMMAEVVRSGLIHLAMIPIDPENPAMTEVELYRNVPG